jgi:hypothetical protein
MWRESHRRRLGVKEEVPLPVFDLNNPLHRRTFAVVLVAGGVLAVLLSLSAYNTYLFTDSVAFCGTICHTVMKPQYTAYLNSPHARVPCVDCHVGPGVAWYLRSKVAGAPQVLGYSVLIRSHSRLPLRAYGRRERPANNATGRKSFLEPSWSRFPIFSMMKKTPRSRSAF